MDVDGRLHGLLRRVDDLLHHRHPHQGRARAERDRVRPARRHADPHRIAVARRAGHLDGPLRRAPRLHADDAGGERRDRAARLRHTYPQMLLAALGVGLAGGSFAVGVAYVSRFFPQGRRARRSASSASAMSAPRSPSSLRRSCCSPGAGRPWRTFGLRCSPSWPSCSGSRRFDDPVLVERRKTGPRRSRSWLELRRRSRTRASGASRFYYFFVFGAFVALALWLPRYLIGVYGFEHRHRRHDRAPSLDPGQHLPRLRRRAVGPRRRAHRHVLEPRRLGCGDAHPVAAADRHS